VHEEFNLACDNVQILLITWPFCHFILSHRNNNGLPHKTVVRTRTLRSVSELKPITKETYGSIQKKTVQSGIIRHQEDRVELATNQKGNTYDEGTGWRLYVP
jgi:hypothetical protein